MILSSRDVSVPFFVAKAILIVLNRKCFTLIIGANLAFCELSDGDVIGAGVFAVLVHLFKTQITFLFVGLSLLCDPE